jgi:hypothetical protein
MMREEGIVMGIARRLKLWWRLFSFQMAVVIEWMGDR